MRQDKSLRAKQQHLQAQGCAVQMKPHFALAPISFCNQKIGVSAHLDQRIGPTAAAAEGDDNQILNSETKAPFSYSDSCAEKGPTIAFNEAAHKLLPAKCWRGRQPNYRRPNFSHTISIHPGKRFRGNAFEEAGMARDGTIGLKGLLAMTAEGAASPHRWVRVWPFSRLSIAARITAIALTLVLPLNLVVGAVIWHLSDAAGEAQRTSLLYAARSIVAASDAKLGEYTALAEALARSPSILEDNLEAFEAEARRAFASSPDALVVVADPNGQQLLNTMRRPGQPLPIRDPIGLATQQRGFETHSTVISDVHVGAVSQQWVINIEVPIFKNGEPFRTLAAAVKAQSFFRLLNDQLIPKDWRAGITDRQGRFIARARHNKDDERYIGQPAADGSRNLKDQEGVFELTSLDGDPVVSAHASSAMSGWVAGVAIKKKTMQAATWRAIRWALILGGGFSVLSLALAGIIARSITRPIDRLRSQAAALLAGPLRGLAAIGPPEVKELWLALQQSAAERDQSEEKLRFALDAAELGIWRLRGRQAAGE